MRFYVCSDNRMDWKLFQSKQAGGIVLSEDWLTMTLYLALSYDWTAPAPILSESGYYFSTEYALTLADALEEASVDLRNRRRGETCSWMEHIIAFCRKGAFFMIADDAEPLSSSSSQDYVLPSDQVSMVADNDRGGLVVYASRRGLTFARGSTFSGIKSADFETEGSKNGRITFEATTIIPPISYLSPIRGITAAQADIPVVYYGKILKVPGRLMGAAQVKMTTDPKTFLRTLPDEVPYPNGVIERYEIRDIDTGDLMVMWRVPYIKKRRSALSG